MKLSYSFLDAAIIITIIYFAWKGYKEGCIDNLIGFIGFLIVMFFAIQHMASLADQLISVFQVDRLLLTIIAFCIIVAGGWFFMRLIVTKLQLEINPSKNMKSIDQVAGGILGIVQGGILVSLIAMLIMLTPFAGSLDDQKKQSMLLKPAMRMAPGVFNSFALVFPGAKNFADELEKSINKSEHNPQANELLKEIRDNEANRKSGNRSRAGYSGNRSNNNQSGRKNRRR